MKKVTLAIIPLLISSIASAAEWVVDESNNEARLSDSKNVFTLIVGKGVRQEPFPVIGYPLGDECLKRAGLAPKEAAPIEIQGVAVKIMTMCNEKGSFLIFPETSAGRKHLTDVIMSNKNISIKTLSGDGSEKEILFENRDGKEALYEAILKSGPI